MIPWVLIEWLNVQHLLKVIAQRAELQPAPLVVAVAEIEKHTLIRALLTLRLLHIKLEAASTVVVVAGVTTE